MNLTRETYEQRFAETLKFSGRGVEVVVHMPCPFCAAPEWYSVSLVEFGHEMDPHVCPECHRSARFVFDGEGDTMTARLVQCGGDTAPRWLQPMPREDREEPVPSSPGHLRATQPRKRLHPGQSPRPKQLGRGRGVKR